MTTGAWIMLILAWGSIISMAIFCIYKTLQQPPRTPAESSGNEAKK